MVPQENLADMVSSVIDTIMKNDAKKTLKDKLISNNWGNKRGQYVKATSINEELLPVLMTLVGKHQNYTKFLKDCGMLTPERTKTIVEEIYHIFAIIRSREKWVMDIDEVGKVGDKDGESASGKNSSSSSSSVS